MRARLAHTYYIKWPVTQKIMDEIYYSTPDTSVYSDVFLKTNPEELIR